MRLAGKTALITGGNSGIGLATARLFLAEGAQVAITGRNPKTLDVANKELGTRVLAVQADVTKVGDLERAVAATADHRCSRRRRVRPRSQDDPRGRAPLD